MSQPFGDIPLFRELQRILASGEGPVNLEIARQIAGTIATQSPDPSPRREVTESFNRAVHEVEGVLSGYSRLALEEPLKVVTFGRATWVLRALDGWFWLLKALATRFTAQLSAIGGEGDPSEAGAEANPMGQMMGQIAPLLLGIQTGTVVGHLSLGCLTRHDPPIPYEDDGALFFVTSNVETLAEAYDFDPSDFSRWLVLHSAARQLLASSTPWTARYLRSLLLALVASIEIDPVDIERRLMDLQAGGAEALGGAAGADQLIPVAQTERHRIATQNLRSFLAIADGYAEHVVASVTPTLLPDAARINEGMARHRAAPSEGKSMLSSVLGLERDPGLESAGQTFCAAVVQLRGIEALNVVWAAPDNLPTLEEIKDPFLWMERVLVEEGS